MRIGYTDTADGHTYIIAELSANHAGELDTALATVDAVAKSGADAIKLQTYRPESLTLDVLGPDFEANAFGPWAGRRLYDLYSEAMTPWEWHRPIKERAESLGLDFLSTPFDLNAVDFLEDLGVVAYKIASFEISDLPLISKAASKGLPVIISTGVATEEDVENAVRACKDVGNEKIVLLKCTSAYPTVAEDAHLNAIKFLKERFGTEVGLSDHTLGIVAPVVAVALGAKLVEKHVMLNEFVSSPDSSFSLTVDQFSEMVNAIRFAEKALGQPSLKLSDAARKSRDSRRSLYIVKDVAKGEIITEDDIRSIRPAKGLPPARRAQIVGMRAVRDLKQGEPAVDDMFE